MKRLLTALLIASGLCAPAFAADIRPGLWEFRSRVSMPGMEDAMARMQEELKRMPPETRRMMEERMASQGLALGNGGAIKVCITAEDVKRSDLFSGRQEGDCSYSQVANTPALVKGTLQCRNPKASGQFEARIDSPTHFTSTVNMASEQGAMQSETDARWIGADCGTLKPTAR